MAPRPQLASCLPGITLFSQQVSILCLFFPQKLQNHEDLSIQGLLKRLTIVLDLNGGTPFPVDIKVVDESSKIISN